MLSERERRELEVIERELDSDLRFVARFRRRLRRHTGSYLVRARLLCAFGVLVMAAAIVLQLGGTFAQGLLLTGVGVWWWRRIVKESWKGASPGSTRGRG